MRRSDPSAWWAAAALAVAGLMRWPSLGLALDRDEGEFATLAWLWRGGRGLPYRDWLEQKPPLTLLPHWLAQAAFDDPVLGLRCLSLAWTLATVGALFLLLRSMGRRGLLGARLRFDPRQSAAAAGLGALGAALLLGSARTQSLAANTETWQTLPMLAALAVLWGVPGPRRNLARCFASGLCLGLGSLFKQPLLAGVLFLPWAALEDGRPLLPAVAACVAGAASAWVLAGVVFLSQGGLADFLNCTLAYNQDYVAQGWGGALSRGLGLALRLAPELGAAALAAALGWRSLGRWGASRRLFAAWLGVALVSLAASGRYYPHYAVLLLAPLGALAGLGLHGALWPPAWDGPGGKPRRTWTLAASALALLGLAWGVAPVWAAPAAARSDRLYGVPSFGSAPAAARRLRELCPPDQKLFIWGNEAELYFLAQREPAGRFLFIYPFTGEAPAWPDGDKQVEAALGDPDTGAAVLAAPLDPTDPLQMRVLLGLKGGFVADQSVPGWTLGSRRR